jgi:predicted TIM-barrel fold metal-dependent hydrolase
MMPKATAAARPNQGKPVDMHVHIVGNGSGGTGCWLRVSGWHRPLAALMIRQIGLPAGAMRGDLDSLYARHLSRLVRESSLGAAVILAHEQVYEADGRLMEGRGSFYVPNEYVLSLARQYPEFLPAVSIHPARRDALEELDRCLEAGAVMMKCLPNCHNIDCNDRRYLKFWERMAAAGLPLLAHTGGEHTVPVVRRELADPRTLELPLQCGVNVIAAHCGTKSGLFDPEYFHVFTEMLGRYPNLYGDNSAFNVPIRGRHVRECLVHPLHGRILHGSDYPVPVHGHFAWTKGYVDWATFRRWEKSPNVLERDYQLKRAAGFPEESFTKIWALLRLGRSTGAATNRVA